MTLNTDPQNQEPGQARSALTITSINIHKIDIQNNQVSKPYNELTNREIKSYVEEIIFEVIKSNRTQSYKFDEKYSKLPEVIKSLSTESFDSSSTDLAAKLLSCEVAAQERYKSITEIRKGSLLSVHFEAISREFLLLVKIDHASFFDETEYTKKTGLPEKQRAQKSALFELISGELNPTVIVSDSSQKITDYWYRDFLSLIPLSSNEKNTEDAFKAVETLLTRKLSKRSPSDYWTLRNATVSYFATRSECIFPEMINELFSGFEPDDKTINIQEIISEALELPGKKGFDSHFSIIKNVIKARVKKQIRLAENLELQIKGEIPDYDRVFSTGEDGSGKYLKIYSEHGYQEFKRNRESQDDN